MFRVGIFEILCRLGLVILTSGIIGFDREQKNRPAGMRTHILVGIGACIIAMMQQEIAAQAVIFAKSNPANRYCHSSRPSSSYRSSC